MKLFVAASIGEAHQAANAAVREGLAQLPPTWLAHDAEQKRPQLWRQNIRGLTD